MAIETRANIIQNSGLADIRGKASVRAKGTQSLRSNTVISPERNDSDRTRQTDQEESKAVKEAKKQIREAQKRLPEKPGTGLSVIA